MNRFAPLASLLALFFVSGCAGALQATPMSNVVKPDVVKAKAGSDLACKDVVVTQAGATNWKAEGCGKTATYVCWTSVGMGDGMCTREGAMPSP